MNTGTSLERRAALGGVLLCGLWIGATTSAPAAAVVTRGPYLQQGTPASLIVCWRTSEATAGFVRFGTEATNLIHTATNANVVSNHVVAITNLLPGTQYFYEIGTGLGWFPGGADQYFITSPPVGTVKSTRLWVIGDSGEPGIDAMMVRDAYAAHNGARPTDLWLMLGDNAYNSGTDQEYQAAVFEMYPAVLRNTMLWPTVGNHDKDLSYFEIFTLPQNGEAGGLASGTESYYSFDYANIHFVCLDSYRADRTTNGPMYAWLRADLEAMTAEWLIAFWHHPPYTHGTHDSDQEVELIEMRETYVPMLESYGVDLVLNGHSHGYERSYLLNGHYGGSTTFTNSMKMNAGSGREDGDGSYLKPAGVSGGQGTVYTVAGCGSKASNPAPHPAMFYSLGEVGSLVIDITGNRLDLLYLTGFGTNADYFTIIKAPLATNAPSAPTHLAAVGVAAHRVELSWIDTATDESSFRLERSSNGVDFVQFTVVPANVTNAADTSLASDTTYYYRVRAHNIIGDSDYSGIAPATTLPPPPDLTPPDAVIDLAPVALTSNSVTLRWTAPGDDGSEGIASGYDVRVSTAPIDETTWPLATPAPNPPVPGVAGTVETLVIEGLAAGTPYWFALKTVDETNNLSPLSNVPTGTTLLPGRPAPPTTLVATAVTSNRIALTWVDYADNETFFSIERFSNGVNFVSIGSVGVNVTNYLDSGLVPETTYFYRVKAGNAVSDSPPSNIAQATTLSVVPPDTTPPAPVADLRTGTVTTNSVTLAWTAPGDDGNFGTARRYDLRYRTSLITEANWATSTPYLNAPVPLTAGSTQTATVAGLRDDTTYFFAVKTADETDNLSPLSNVPSVTTPVMTDTPSLGATNSVLLILSNSVWKYLDNGSNQGAAWAAPGFDDTSWASGPAQIGFGNGSRDITIASFGPDPNHKPITTYFRRGFTVADPSLFESLRVSVVRDDGAVVYLNGSEVYRDNMPAGPINYLTVAASSVSGTNKTSFHPSPPFAPAPLQTGNNVVAVEVHQRSASSSQLAFNLELSATLARPVIQIALNPAGQVSLQWNTYPGKHYRVLRAVAPAASTWTNLGADITAAGPTASATDSVLAGTGRYYRVLLLD